MSNYHLVNEFIVKVGNSQPLENKAEAYFLKLGGHAFQEMKKYLTKIERDLRLQKINVRQYYKHQKNANPEWYQLINEISKRDYRELDIHFTQILYSSSFSASFTIFEVMFKKVCVFAAHKYSQKIPPDLIIGTINDCRSYIVSTLRMDISEVNDLWKKLIKYRTVRNDIVHHNGVITKETNTIVKFLKGQRHVQVRKIRNKDQFVFTILERGLFLIFSIAQHNSLLICLANYRRGKGRHCLT